MDETYSPGTPKEQLKANNILFTALISGIVMFLLIAVVLIKFQGKFSDNDNFDRIFLIVVSIIAVICLVSAVSIYNKRINDTANSALPLLEKLNNYRPILIIYLAFCEGAALFSVTCLILTGNFWSIGVTTTMLIAMFFKRPTRQRLINDLQLDWQEQQEL
jgi:O-antigen/teichoic acid export membrane protein